MSNKRAMSPVVATLLFIIFSLILGSLVMNLAKNYISNLKEKEVGVVIMVPKDYVDNELKELQIEYIMNKISYEDYLTKEKELIKKE